ncbi:MAG: bifunctional phosphoribosyl-AMP cyclohydrolase/phosphoribosyl-ATP diphosphatase [Flavobacteriales bacterium]|nr:MAG: bifunctional phosphoribosyl-AMP cyclohydrolase/phosphoribosyl-ATP diphosphatase [Flavobacteriales bacterium]
MKLNYEKNNGLIPAIVQDAETCKVLMLGYMNEEALEKTQAEGKVTFYSRTKKRLWTKGETSGNYLDLVSITPDCDNDTLLLKATPAGPICHKGTDTCFDEENKNTPNFINELEGVIKNRKQNPTDKSYTASLFKKGINTIAQKVGEEAIELIIEAKDNNDKLFLNEAADLLYHYLVLLQLKGKELKDVVKVLEERHRK